MAQATDGASVLISRENLASKDRLMHPLPGHPLLIDPHLLFDRGLSSLKRIHRLKISGGNDKPLPDWLFTDYTAPDSFQLQ
jgi:hypothetical protein